MYKDVHSTATFLLRKNSRPEVYTDVHFWIGYFQKAYGKRIFKSIGSKIDGASTSSDADGNGFAFQFAALCGNLYRADFSERFNPKAADSADKGKFLRTDNLCGTFQLNLHNLGAIG